MAKVFGVKELEDKVRATFDKSIKSSSNLDRLAKLAKDRIYQTVKTGSSMSGGVKAKLKELSDGYKKYRRKYQTIYKTGDYFSPTRSNLTFTGQMLDALTYKIVASKGAFEIYVSATVRTATNKVNALKVAKSLMGKKSVRRRAKRALQDRSGVRDERLTNAEVAQKVADNGRPFLGLDERSKERLRSEIIKDLRRAISIKGLRS